VIVRTWFPFAYPTTGAQVAIHWANKVVFPVAVIVSPGINRLPVPSANVFQPTKVKPVFVRFPVLPGRVGDCDSFVVIVEGTVPVVGVFPLKVILRFHIAKSVVDPAAVNVSPGRYEVPLRLAIVFQPANVKLVRSNVVGAGSKNLFPAVPVIVRTTGTVEEAEVFPFPL
jgi:hypothetical protein